MMILKRAFDILISLILLVVFALPMLIIGLLIRISSAGPAIHWSKRIGKNNQIFLMPKFRTMKIETPQVATHLLQDPEQYLTPIGKLLRKTSLDELPQIYSVLIGDMSLVGPRPALFNQQDLIHLRTQHLIHTLRPGITGWAQINGRDEIPLQQKVELDKQYLQHQSIVFDLKILILTIQKVFQAEGVSH